MVFGVGIKLKHWCKMGETNEVNHLNTNKKIFFKCIKTAPC